MKGFTLADDMDYMADGYTGELYEVLVSGDGTMAPIMEEIVSGADASLIEGRAFYVPAERLEGIIAALFARRFGGYNSLKKEHILLRAAIKARLYDSYDGQAAVFGSEIADLFSLGRYGFSDSDEGE